MKSPGSLLCLGGCGQRVSANKRRCLKCLASEVRKNLASMGREVDDAEVSRLLAVYATGGY